MPTAPDSPEEHAVLGGEAVGRLREQLPIVARHTVEAVVSEVADYADPLRGRLGQNIAEAVELALGTFLRLVEHPDGDRQALPAALDGAYALGRGEARSGRSMAALLAAYRVGARTAWSDWGTAAVEAGSSPEAMVGFAEAVFTYIDQLSAASVAGHGDELAMSGRVREQQLERLGRALLRRAPDDELQSRAEGANWAPPDAMVALLVLTARARSIAGQLDRRTLLIPPDLVDEHLPTNVTVVLAPVPGSRTTLLEGLEGESLVVGPARPWRDVAASYRRARRVFETFGSMDDVHDTEDALTELVVTADPDALADLRARVLEPLGALPPATRARLTETLISWLLHQGRREEVARALHVHPQTVRYRMTQLRELFDERLTDPLYVRDLIVALGPEG